MPDRTTRTLDGHDPRGGTTVHGWASVVIGLIPLGIGVPLLLIAAGVLRVKAAKPPPVALMAGLGGAFALAGLSFVVHGLRGAARNARAERWRRSHPSEPWRADHDWDSAGARHSEFRRIGRLGFGTAFFVVFLAPFNWWAFFSGEGNPVLAGVVGLFDLVPVLLLGHCAYLFSRAVKYGGSLLRFDQFPFFAGEGIRAHFILPRSLGDFRVMTLTLRCIRERVETRGTGKNRSTVIVSDQLYADTMELRGEDRRFAAEDSIPVVFDLPADVPATHLLATPPLYWELEVRADTPGVDFGAVFLIPVYHKKLQ